MKYPSKRIYIYPITRRGTDDSRNPYISNLTSALQKNFHIINKDSPSNSGIAQCFMFFHKVDIFVFNWIENLPDRKAGKLQVFMLLVLFFLGKLFNKKIIWIMHNKLSHSKTNIKIKRKVFINLLQYSDLILTHSSEGIKFARDLYPGMKASRIKFLHHPVSGQITLDTNRVKTPKKFDVMIWGTMAPYKGVDNFLKFLKDKGISNKFYIHIIGKFSSMKYFNKVRNLVSSTITIENRFAGEGELVELTSNSSHVLFPYDDSSILSSGALMDTLTFTTNIIGPNSGAFADLASEGLIQVFNTYEDIVKILEQPTSEHDIQHKHQAMKHFNSKNNWDTFADKMTDLIQHM